MAYADARAFLHPHTPCHRIVTYCRNSSLIDLGISQKFLDLFRFRRRIGYYASVICGERSSDEIHSGKHIGGRHGFGFVVCHELNVIVKGDVDGSVEALSDSLIKLSTEQVQVNVIHKGVGQISESDVTLAAASDVPIVGFQVRPSRQTG